MTVPGNRGGRHFVVLALVFALTGAVFSGAVRAQDQTEAPDTQQGSEAPEPSGAAPDSPDQIKVGLYLNPPFVMKDGDGYTGMAVDLWEASAGDIGLESEYVVFPAVRELVDATAKGDVDAAVTNLTITKKRAERIDFTYPWFDAGLRIMINEDAGAGFWATVKGLNDAGFLRSYAWIALVIVVATLLLTLFDRRFDKDFPSRWREGIAESFYTVMSVATTGRMSRKNLFGWIGRIWSAL